MIKRFLFSKTGFIVTTIIFLLFIIFVLPYFSLLTESKTNTTFSPDTGFFYSIDQFYENMGIYGQAGRDFYILMRWTFDIIWPIVYSSFFVSSLGHLSSQYPKKQKKLIMALPIMAVAFDFLENTLASINVAIYPNRALFLLRLLQISSLLKWFFITLVALALVYLVIINFIKKKKFDNKEFS